MGPIALFDKSFLQSLSVDESVWFDRFFLAVICPIFYVETLADLAKEPSKRGPAEAIVRVVAEKTPEMGGSPCMFHQTLCVNNLRGHAVPMDSRVPRPGGRSVKSGIVYDQAVEEAAFLRWQRGQFLDVERIGAAQWRRELAELDLTEITKIFQRLGIDGKTCRTLGDARKFAREIAEANGDSLEQLRRAIVVLNVPQHFHYEISLAWRAAGQPPLAIYASYAAYVLNVELFFHVALAADLISPDRPSNRMDIAYLFYLPFCTVFVSGDKLHRQCAPLFLRGDQEAIWGPDLKAGLRVVNDHFLKLPQSEREKGVMKLGGYPPPDNLVEELWSRHTRSSPKHEEDVPLAPDAEAKLLAQLKAFRSEPPLGAYESLPSDDPDMLSITRSIRRKRGSWWQVPKDLPDDPET